MLEVFARLFSYSSNGSLPGLYLNGLMGMGFDRMCIQALKVMYYQGFDRIFGLLNTAIQQCFHNRKVLCYGSVFAPRDLDHSFFVWHTTAYTCCDLADLIVHPAMAIIVVIYMVDPHISTLYTKYEKQICAWHHNWCNEASLSYHKLTTI